MWLPLRIAFFVLIANSLMLQECAASNTSLKKEDLESIRKVKVVRSKTPTLDVQGGVNLFAAIFPVVGLVAIPINDQASKDANKNTVPDMGDLLTKSFASQIRNEIPNWREIDIETMPVTMPLSDGYHYRDGNLFTFDISYVCLCRRFSSAVEVQMLDSNGNIVFNGFTRYLADGDYKSPEEYSAEGGKLLIEDMRIASYKMAKEIIKQLKEVQP